MVSAHSLEKPTDSESPELMAYASSRKRTPPMALFNTFFVFINHCNKTTFEESYKQYLYELEYYAPDQKCVSATIFKRLLAKERRILKLVRGLKKDGNSFLPKRNLIYEELKTGL